MNLTTRSSYGVRALVSLTVMNGAACPVSIREIAELEGISDIYLEQIFSTLKKSGILRSVRGPKGGYSLSRDPERVNVYQIVKALEKRSFPSRCLTGRDGCSSCTMSASCVSTEVWAELEKYMKNALEKFSLRDLAEKKTEKLSSKVPRNPSGATKG
ncbi:MAG: Rrf2 family transcriptional regulator [Candidatus Omnitrophica bacterium]|nr:Rrf2 family transcriptional regulator [Candidatus Omnitrophota bacterium]